MKIITGFSISITLLLSAEAATLFKLPTDSPPLFVTPTFPTSELAYGFVALTNSLEIITLDIAIDSSIAPVAAFFALGHFSHSSLVPSSSRILGSPSATSSAFSIGTVFNFSSNEFLSGSDFTLFVEFDLDTQMTQYGEILGASFSGDAVDLQQAYVDGVNALATPSPALTLSGTIIPEPTSSILLLSSLSLLSLGRTRR